MTIPNPDPDQVETGKSTVPSSSASGGSDQTSSPTTKPVGTEDCKQRLESILDFLPDATFVIDREKRVIFWNRACEELTGVKKEDILGQGNYAYALPFYGERKPVLIDLLDFKDDLVEVNYPVFQRKGSVIHAEAFVQRVRGGQGAYLWGEISPLYDKSGRRCGAVEVIRDITDHTRLEAERAKLADQLRASQKMEAIGSLAGGVAHDFNNILSVILGLSEMSLMQAQDNPVLRDNLVEIRNACERASNLTRQLLAFSRKQVMHPVTLDLNQVVTGMVKMLQRLIRENVSLRLVLAPDLGMVQADPSQVEQVVMNLVINSRDAMPNGGTILIETSNVQLSEDYAAQHLDVKPGYYVQIAVTDSGCGMSEDILSKVFEPFFTTKEKGKGTGLGLPTVYGIVKQSGGDIWVYSEPGMGTTFKIHFPRDLAVKPPTAQPEEVLRQRGGTETILVVDDDDAVLNVTKKMLDLAGYNVLTANDGESALSVREHYQGDIHLLLTDVVMPRLSGHQLAEEFRTRFPKTKVVYMSGYTDQAIFNRGVLDAGTPYLSKPFSSAALTGKVREVLDGATQTPPSA
jgi:PAS domain S-box-containing protein